MTRSGLQNFKWQNFLHFFYISWMFLRIYREIPKGMRHVYHELCQCLRQTIIPQITTALMTAKTGREARVGAGVAGTKSASTFVVEPVFTSTVTE